jgi:DNA-directed RNA polymerase subunit H (RpoH/RPB5)
MPTAPTLSPQEWNIILDLLEIEQTELPQEIHHTDSPAAKELLQKRKKLVDEMIPKIRGPRK